eukprot:c18320_g1_i1 orf=219-383(+)
MPRHNSRFKVFWAFEVGGKTPFDRVPIIPGPSSSYDTMSKGINTCAMYQFLNKY